MLSTRFFGISIVAILFLGGCAWSQPPASSDIASLNWDIQEPTRTEPEAEIILSDDGLWAYLALEKREFVASLAPGDLAVMEADEESHLFAIIEVGEWGYRMQRLDDRTVQRELSGYLRPLNSGDISESEDLCILSFGQQLEEVCGVDYRHQRWHLYELEATSDSSATTRRVSGTFGSVDDALGFPISRHSLVGTDFLLSWTDSSAEATSDAPLLAIRAQDRDRTTLRARVVYDSSCFESGTTSSRIEWVALQNGESLALPSGHPLAVEAAALRLGADALVECVDNQPRLHVPVLTRPLLSNDQDRFVTPPAMGLIPRELGDTTTGGRQAWVTAAAFVAIGDTSAASFWIEEAIKYPAESHELRELGLVAMPILTSGGQAELAMRLGLRMTRGGWNPENVPDYLDGLIVLLGYFQMEDQQRKHIKDRRAPGAYRRDPHRTAWYRWASLRMNLDNHRGTHGPAYNELIANLEENELEEWALAIWTTFAIHDKSLPVVDDPELLIPRFTAQQADHLWRMIISTPAPTTCVSASAQPGCTPDSYAWSPGTSSTDATTIEALRITANTSARRAYSYDLLSPHAPSNEHPAEQTAYWLATAPLSPPDDLHKLTHAMSDSLREQLAEGTDTTCEDLGLWRARFENAAARTRTPVMTESRRQWVNYITWWSDIGLEALCTDDDAFLTALEIRQTESNRWTGSVLPILEDRLLRSESPVTDVSLFQRASRLALALEDQDTCTLWSLGMSIGAARSARFDAADQHLISATNCMRTDSEWRGARNIVAGYIDFERAAGRNITRDSAVGHAIDRAARKESTADDICVGLLPLDFDLNSQLPSSIVRIADRVQMAPAEQDNFRLRSASGIIDQGRAAYLTGIRDLQRGYMTTAARSLELAHASFLRLGHAPGLARIQFLDETIYGGQLQAVARRQDEIELNTATSAIESIRSGQSHTFLDDFTRELSDSDPDPDRAEATIAALLINGREQEILTLTSVDALPRSLCRTSSDDEPIEDVDYDGPLILDSVSP